MVAPNAEINGIIECGASRRSSRPLSEPITAARLTADGPSGFFVLVSEAIIRWWRRKIRPPALTVHVCL